ncbi:universal stress protein [Halopiger goleimassiliensis]|uniref:universal stress protein n=1 Tax=Halopiger goleimassiliensis TaxID=1293048 RepID=UPI00067811AD|nr:universal stress protein [Halopiger goleimassiliensis]
MHYLAGTDSVHTTASICDYLEDRATADDTVTVIATVPPDESNARRDGREALNVAPIRLQAVGEVETDLRDGDPATVLLEAAAELDVDELVVGVHGGAPDAGPGVGTTTATVLGEAERPVVVVPHPER